MSSDMKGFGSVKAVFSLSGTAKSQAPRPPCELLGGVNVWGWWGEATAIRESMKSQQLPAESLAAH